MPTQNPRITFTVSAETMKAIPKVKNTLLPKPGSRVYIIHYQAVPSRHP